MWQIRQSFNLPQDFPVCFDRDVFAPQNTTLVDILALAGSGPHRILPVVDDQVLRGHPHLLQQLSAYAEAHRDRLTLIDPALVVRGGEICKSDPRELDEFYRRTQTDKIDRHSFVLVIGGGAVLDAMGYAAATAHRGIRLIRMPSTVLAQNDAGIGVKNAINYRGRKNYLGTFTCPFAVINDYQLLDSLPARECIAGMAEAVKVALIRDGKFFNWLHAKRRALARFEPQAMEHMIARCAELHLEHIRTSGDPYEQGSARPLDFGHWCAHRLEELSDAKLRHGEAVAIGIALDSLYSHAQGMIDTRTLNRIIETLEGVGFKLQHPALQELDIHAALEGFREHLGGKLCITLLSGAGEGREIDWIDQACMDACRQQLLADRLQAQTLEAQ